MASALCVFSSDTNCMEKRCCMSNEIWTCACNLKRITTTASTLMSVLMTDVAFSREVSVTLVPSLSVEVTTATVAGVLYSETHLMLVLLIILTICLLIFFVLAGMMLFVRGAFRCRGSCTDCSGLLWRRCLSCVGWSRSANEHVYFDIEMGGPSMHTA